MARGATAYNVITMTFTNLPTNSCTFVVNGTSITWTTAPLNNVSWIQSNSIAGSATNLTRRLGQQFPQWRTYQTNSTNVVIAGSGLQFSITGNYGVTTTNSLSANTNRWLVSLPFDYDFETNRTNTASEIARGISLYASNFSWAIGSNKVLSANHINGGAVSNTYLTNISRANVNGLVATQLNAFSGSLSNINITNASWVTSDSNRFGTITVARGGTVSNLTGTFKAPKLFSGTTGNEVLVTNEVGSVAQIIIDGSDGSAGGGILFQFAGVMEWALGGDTNDWGFYNASGNLITLSKAATSTNVIVGDPLFPIMLRGAANADVIRITNSVRYTQTGPWTFSEGVYTAMTGGSNNVVQLSTNAWTRLSGHVSAANVNSLRTGDGLPNGGRRVGIVNGGSYDLTLIDQASDGFETLSTNRLDLGGRNITLAPKDRAEFVRGGTHWEICYPIPATNLVVKTTADFSGANTVNVVAFNAQQIQRMTNAMTTNTTFIVSNILAGSSVEIYLTGANGGVIASNYTFKLLTNGITTATRITWQTNRVALTNGTYDHAVQSNAFARILLSAPFTTNVWARYEEVP